MLSPSRGFCFCLPVRFGALLVSFLAFLASAIFAGVTFGALATVSPHITSIQTTGFYLTSVSWASLSLFSLLGFISVILQNPLILTIFARFVVYHLPASLLCNLFLTIVLFQSYRNADAIVRSPQCGRPNISVCEAGVSLQTMTWLYLFALIPASIAQIYVYVIFKRFIFVVSGEWALDQELALERQRRSMGKMPDRLRRMTITRTTGRGRRRANAELWFTMETPGKDADDSFLPSMIISPMDFTSPPRTPGSTAPLLPTSFFPRLGKKSSKSTLPPLPSDEAIAVPGTEKDGTSDGLAVLDMDFSDPEPAPSTPHPAEWKVTQLEGHLDGNLQNGRESDGNVYFSGLLKRPNEYR